MCHHCLRSSPCRSICGPTSARAWPSCLSVCAACASLTAKVGRHMFCFGLHAPRSLACLQSLLGCWRRGFSPWLLPSKSACPLPFALKRRPAAARACVLLPPLLTVLPAVYLSTVPGCILADDMGLGKTLQGIRWGAVHKCRVHYKAAPTAIVRLLMENAPRVGPPLCACPPGPPCLKACPGHTCSCPPCALPQHPQPAVDAGEQQGAFLVGRGAHCQARHHLLPHLAGWVSGPSVRKRHVPPDSAGLFDLRYELGTC